MDFAQLEANYSPKKADGQYEPPLAKMPDGEWEMEIKDGFLYETKYGKPAYKFILTNIAAGTPYDGWEIHRSTFLDSIPSVNILAGQLCALGIDADQWGESKGRPIQSELKKLIETMRGWIVRCRKSKTVGKNGQTYHNLYFISKSGVVKPKDSEENDLPF